MIDNLYKRMLSVLRPGSITSTRDDGPVQVAQVKVSDLELRDGVVNCGWWGFTSRPHPGAQVLIAVPGGNAAGGIIIASGDQRYTFHLSEGECAIFDDLGQSVHLKRTGITVNGGGLPILLENSPVITADTPLLRCTGDIQDNYGVNANTMANMREIYDIHTHNVENIQYGGSTRVSDIPNQLE